MSLIGGHIKGLLLLSGQDAEDLNLHLSETSEEDTSSEIVRDETPFYANQLEDPDVYNWYMYHFAGECWYALKFSSA